MTLQQLRYFAAAAQHGSFSAGAHTLRLSQPAVSEQVRQLEGELGVQLFIRVGRGLRLTDAGQAFLPQAVRVLHAVDEAAESVAEVRTLHGGTVAFGLFRNAVYYVVADLVDDFASSHPDVRLRLPGQNSAEVADAVRDGKLEAALVVLPVDDQGLDVRPLMRDEVLYVTGTPDRARKAVTIEQVASAPLILYDARYGWDDPTRRQLAERAQRVGLKIEPQIEIEFIDAALDMVDRGLGDTIIATMLTLRPGFPSALLTVPFAEPLYDTFALISRHNARLSPAARELAALAEARMVELGRRLAEISGRATLFRQDEGWTSP